MALKETINQLNKLLEQIHHDLQKAGHGNKAASQRVRTGTVRLEKIAKQYRKESVMEEKKPGGRKRPAGGKKKAGTKTQGRRMAAKKTAATKKAATTKRAPTAKKKAPMSRKTKKVTASPKKKATKTKSRGAKAQRSKSMLTRLNPFAFKRSTAKLPTKRPQAR